MNNYSIICDALNSQQHNYTKHRRRRRQWQQSARLENEQQTSNRTHDAHKNVSFLNRLN